MKRFLLILLLATPAFPQSWSTFLDTTRATDWTTAGFTIPNYTVACSTQPSLVAGSGNATANTASVIASMTSCDATHNVVNIPAGTWFLNKTAFPHGSLVVRGAGPQSTFITFLSTAGCVGGIGNQGFCMYDTVGAIYNGNPAALPPSGTQQCLWTGGLTQGSTSITLTSCGGTPPNGKILILDQADDTSDTSGVYICQQTGAAAPTNCNNDGTGNENGRVISGLGHSQQQVVKITSVTSCGAGCSTVGISPGVYFTNIRSGQSPGAWWPGYVTNEGIENMSIDGSALAGTIGIGQCYQCWVKNIISINAGRNHIGLYMSLNDVVRDSYFYGAQTHGSSSYSVEFEETSQSLVENNIMQQVVAPIMFGQGSGNVIGYNFDVNNYYTGNGSTPPDVLEAAASSHNSGNEMNLWEGNVGQAIWADNVWGSSSQITYFRNATSGWQTKFPGGATTCGTVLCEETPFILRSFNRDFNIIGNIIGQPSYNLTYEMYATSTTVGTGGSEDNSIYSLGWSTGGFGGTNNGGCGATLCDPPVRNTLMRWGNYDTVNNVVRWNSTEAAPAANTFVSANFTTGYFNTLAQTLPASLYYGSTPSWWPSGKAWPPIGPDVTTGNVSTCNGGTFAKSRATAAGQCTGGSLNTVSGTASAWASHVVSNPAQDCYLSTLSGPPDGTGSVLPFDAAVCAAAAPTNNTFYIRPDGGTRWTASHSTGQCDGKSDVAYPGSGTNQHCAFNDVRWLWDDQTFGNYPNWAIVGGDTVIVRANTAGAPWRVGFQGNGSSTDPWCFGGSGAFACGMPGIPSGTTGQHTKFLGENFAACNTTRTIMTVNGPRVQAIPDVSKTTKIFGGHGVFTVVNAAASNNVDVQCLDISSFTPACQLQGSPNTNPCHSSIPLSDYVSDGLVTSNTSGNLLLQDIYIHGTNSRGIHGQQGVLPVTGNRIWISITPQTGWDFDDGHASGTGSFTLTNSIIECSGCQQLNAPPNYPPLSDAQLWQDVNNAFSQGTGAVIGDAMGTPPSSGFPVAMDSNVFQWNTQDGPDWGHMDTGSFPFSATNNVSQHNMGQVFKVGWSFSTVTLLNNITMADCARMKAGNQLPGGVSSTLNQFLVDACRAGDNWSINFNHSTNMLLANNTIVGYQPTFFDYKCVDGANDCSAAAWNINNNIILAYNNPAVNSGISPADFCGPSCNGPPFTTIGTINRKNNIYFNMRVCHANVITPDAASGTSTGESCVSPQFIGQPVSPMTSFSSLDGFNYNLAGTSPAIGGGVSYAGLPAKDYALTNTTSPPVIGALNGTSGASSIRSRGKINSRGKIVLK